ncbi:MAG: AAA family ATPase [Myxococcota bacterium]
MTGRLRIAVLGELAVTRPDGERMPLPQSKKTRALLGYLAITRKDHRRDRLTRLLWDVTDDPRGALRWSLSKLRRVVDEGEVKRLLATRETARLDRDAIDLDLAAVEAVAKAPEDASTEALEEAAAAFHGELLEGLDLDEFFDYEAWLVGQREHARELLGALSEALIARHANAPDRALAHARTLVRSEPLDVARRVRLIQLLVATGRRAEADKHVESGHRLAKDLGQPIPVALRQALTPTSAEPPPAEPPRPSEDFGRVSTLHLEVPIMKSTIHGHALFGREGELKELAERLDLARESGRLQGTLIDGEPGVGKSRLLVELMTETRRRRGYLVEGSAFEVEQSRPFGPWRDAFKRLPKKHVDGAGLTSLARTDAPALERAALFEAVSAFLMERARAHAPLLLAFDDFQWFDEASASLLHYVVRSCKDAPIAVMLAARGGELVDNVDALRAVRGLRTKRLLQPYDLGALDERAIDLLTRPLGPLLDPAQLHRESGGNPLYALELARSGPRGALEAPTLAQLVRDRVERLPAGADAVLRWAAVLGTTFSVPLLTALTSEPEGLLDVLEALERHALVGSVVDFNEPGGTYAFAHDLVRRVVYADLSLPRRRLMHARVVEVLARMAETKPSAVLDLAHHAKLAGQPAVAVDACARAAARCLELGAPREALGYAQQGEKLAETLAEGVAGTRAGELEGLRNEARAALESETAAAAAAK